MARSKATRNRSKIFRQRAAPVVVPVLGVGGALGGVGAAHLLTDAIDVDPATLQIGGAVVGGVVGLAAAAWLLTS